MNFQEGAYIYINKPYRMTSFGALAHIRYVVSKRIGVKRVKMGHAGTLDPLATGVLILCTGKATKQIERLQQHTKEYTATLQLGATTPHCIGPSSAFSRCFQSRYPAQRRGIARTWVQLLAFFAGVQRYKRFPNLQKKKRAC